MAPPCGGAADGPGRAVPGVVGRGGAGLGARPARRERSRRRVHPGDGAAAGHAAPVRVRRPVSVKAALTDGQGRTAALPGVHVQTTPTGDSGLIVTPGTSGRPRPSSSTSRRWRPTCTAWPGAACPPTTCTPRAGWSCSASSGTPRVSPGQVDDPLPGTARGPAAVGAAPRRRAGRGGRGPVSASGRRRDPRSRRRLRRLALRPPRRHSSSSRRSSRSRPPGDGGPLSLCSTGSYGLRWAGARRRRAARVRLALAPPRRRRLPGSPCCGLGPDPGAARPRRRRRPAGAGARRRSRGGGLTLGRRRRRPGARRPRPAAGRRTAASCAALVRTTGRVAVVSLALVAVTGIAMSGRERRLRSTRSCSPPTAGCCSSRSRWWPSSWSCALVRRALGAG